jgi:hypothetical protein
MSLNPLDWHAPSSLMPVFAGIFLCLILAGEIGYQTGRWSERRHPHREREVSGVGAITTGMFGLLAFCLGLTISIAQDRYEARRQLVVQEANAIGTAWLRAKLADGDEGPAILAEVEEYAKVRLAYIAAPTVDPEPLLIARTNALQNDIWNHVQTLARRVPTPITASLAASLNDMFDASSAQRFAFDSRVPGHLPIMLFGGALLAIGAMGFSLGLAGTRQLVLLWLMLLMWTGGMILIIDLSRPRIGMVRVDPAPLSWTIQGFGSGSASGR